MTFGNTAKTWWQEAAKTGHRRWRFSTTSQCSCTINATKRCGLLGLQGSRAAPSCSAPLLTHSNIAT